MKTSGLQSELHKKLVAGYITRGVNVLQTEVSLNPGRGA